MQLADCECFSRASLSICEKGADASILGEGHKVCYEVLVDVLRGRLVIKELIYLIPEGLKVVSKVMEKRIIVWALTLSTRCCKGW